MAYSRHGITKEFYKVPKISFVSHVNSLFYEVQNSPCFISDNKSVSWGGECQVRNYDQVMSLLVAKNN